MKNFAKWLLIFVIFFIGTVAVLNIDQECKEMTGDGGQIVSKLE